MEMDEKKDIFIATSCPPLESLSIFFDEPFDAEIAAHVSSCEKCQAILADYDQIERLQLDRAAAPAGLEESILLLCHQQNAAKKPFFAYPSKGYSWLRLAAGLTFLAAGATLLTYIAGSGQRTDNSAILAKHHLAQPEGINEQLSKIEQTLPDEVFSLNDQMRLHGNIDADSLQNVSTAPKIATSSAQRKFRIGSQVEHIWLVDNLQAGKQALQALAAANNCPLGWQEEENNHTIKASISSSDKNIQSLVNTLKDRQWVLLSPAWPQPYAENRTVLTGNKIQYQATIVKKE